MRCRTRRHLAVAAAALWATISVAAMAEPVIPKARPFDLGEVRLVDGPFKQAQDLDAAYLLSLDPDRLLHGFRVNAGLPSTAQPLGGWEDPKCELRGHFVGHYLSACALMYQSTGDARFKRRADYLVAELAKCQQALGGQYLSAFPESFFDRLEAGKRVWAPYYTIHKIMAGLLDVNQLCGNAQALEVDKGMAAYFKGRIDKLSDEQMAVVMRTEFGGMPEVLANLAAVTGNPDDLALAKRFDDHKVFDPLAARQDKLTNLHANTQIPKITGAARIYELTGDDRFHTIADYFWTEVTEKRSFVTGGNSFGEHFRALGVEAGDLIPETAESCNTYNMLKLTRHLMEWEPRPEYADYYERALYNHILGSIDPNSGMTTYFLSLKPGHFKVYNTPTDSFWCCTGTGVENHAKYGDTIYLHDDDHALWVNLFIPSELTWKEKGVTIQQQTSFPQEQGTTLDVKVTQPTRMTINLRIPSWVASGAAIRINGEPQDAKPQPGTYLPLDREWKDGDKVEVSLPMSLHLYRASDDPNAVAVMYGPIVLAGELGRENYPPTDLLHNQTELSAYPTPRVPVLVTDAGDDVAAWVKPVPGKPLTFTTAGVGQPRDVELSPLYAIHHQRYTVYWKLLGRQQWADVQRQWQTEDDQRRAEDARVIDDAGFGQEQPERDHNFQGEGSKSGYTSGMPYRDAGPGGWFSEDLKVLPDVPLALRCTYWGSDAGRTFDILIDGQKLATETLAGKQKGKWFTVEHPIPAELLQGKQKVTVKFQSADGKPAGGVFACKILRAAPPPPR